MIPKTNRVFTTNSNVLKEGRSGFDRCTDYIDRTGQVDVVLIDLHSTGYIDRKGQVEVILIDVQITLIGQDK